MTGAVWSFTGSLHLELANLSILPLPETMSTAVATLSANEIREEIQAIKKAGKEIRKDRATTFAFLHKHGFVTKHGKLTKRYGG